eukprot:TRINITY_DN13316_c0_g1_i1.p1 TRINITY_DN13316_c0_g1~~TRINITY_DN13316_c0_g1_i1.p1  ORF type:complete len:1665 (+),score=460.04 TRINITY_DN13316_c0_g1_i1:66-5060(+)
MEEGEVSADVDLWAKRGCGMQNILELKEVIDRLSEAGKDSMKHKKILLEMIRGNCLGQSDDATSDLGSLVDIVETVTERGYNALVSEDIISIASALHGVAYGQGSLVIQGRCLELIARTSSSSLTTASIDDISAAVTMVASTFEPSWDSLPTSVLKDGLLILQGLRPMIRLRAIPQQVARGYLRVLCMGCTLKDIPLPIDTPEASSPPATLDEPALLTEESPMVLAFPISSAALWCREALLQSLETDLYHTLYYLRVFLQVRPVHTPTLQHLALLERPAIPMIPPADLAVMRGAITSLRYFIFPCHERKQSEDTLSTKELLVVLTALRYSIASLDSSVVCDVSLFVKKLLTSQVAWHLESHWHIILNVLSDLVQFYTKQGSDWLKDILCSCLLQLLSLKDRIELDTDRARAIELLDIFSAHFEKESKNVCLAVFHHRLSAPGDIKATMKKYFVSERYPMEIRKEFFRLFRNSNPHNRPGYLDTLFKLICKEGSPFTGWNIALSTEVVTYLIELICNLEGSAMMQSTWAELVKICRDIVMHTDEGDDPLRDKRLDICAAIIKSATQRLSTSAIYCTELWSALLALMAHRSPKVRVSVVDYFLGLACNEEFEVTEDKATRTDVFIQSVSRTPTSSVEAELPVAQLLDTVTSRLTHDHQCFQQLLRLVRHVLSNNYFVAGNIDKNTAPLMRLSTVLASLLTDGGWAILTKTGQAASLQDITSTLVSLIPYAHTVNVGKQEVSINIFKGLSGVLKRLLDTQSLVPSGTQSLLPLYCDVFGAIHVALYQLCTLSDLEHAPRQVETAAEMIKVVGGAVLKAIVVIDKLTTKNVGNTSSDKPQVTEGAALLEPVTVHSSHPPSPAPLSPNVHEGGQGGTHTTPPSPAPTAASTTSASMGQSPTTSAPPSIPQSIDSVVQCKQYIVSLLSLIHSIATSPLVDDNMPCKIPSKVLHTFTECVFRLLVEVTDTMKFNHRIHFLAHLVVAELLQQNKRGMLPERTRQEVLRKLIATLKSEAKEKQEEEPPQLGRTRSNASLTASITISEPPTPVQPKVAAPHSGEGRDLIKATADLAWRLFYLGSADAYPQWDPLTEAFFAEGETQCWVTQGPHAPCVVTTTVGRSQHMLVTIRSLSSVCCWTCILHNKPTVPPYQSKPYNHPMPVLVDEPHVEQLLSDDLRSMTADSIHQEHDEEMRGLLRMESSMSSLVFDKDIMDMDCQGPEAKRPALLSEDDIPVAFTKESPIYESPTARMAIKFVPITDKRDKQASPQTRDDCDDSSSTTHRLPVPPSSSAHDLSLVNPTPQRSPTPAIRMMTPVASIASADISHGLSEALANTIHGAFILSMFKMTPAPQRLRWDDQLLRMLSALDKIPCKETHKTGLVYIDYDQYSPGGDPVKHDTPQWSERETCVLSNGSGSLRYQTFMCGLGRFKDLKVPREDPRDTVKKGIWPHPCHYFGALDTARQADGAMCLMHETPVHQIVYHVATIMNSETNGLSESSIRSMVDKKKRHIGNDHVVITYCEDATPDIDPFVLNNELNYINILVQPLADGYSRVTVHFRDCQENKDRSLQELLEEVGFGPALCRSRVGVLVHDTRLSEFVGSAALHASIATKSWRYERQQYSSNWGDRLHRINQLAARCSVKPENRTTDDALLDEYHSKPKSPGVMMRSRTG